jgi:uncharacterized protein YggU (UPF0235/DUF167 family)
MILEVRAKVKVKKEYVKPITEKIYEVAVTEAPHRGKANERIIELLSIHLGVPKSSIKLIRGASSKVKLFKVNL